MNTLAMFSSLHTRLEGVSLRSLEPLEAGYLARMALGVPHNCVGQQPGHGLLTHSKRREVEGAAESVAVDGSQVLVRGLVPGLGIFTQSAEVDPPPPAPLVPRLGRRGRGAAPPPPAGPRAP